MPEDKTFDFSVEIDTDYVRPTPPDPNSHARIATKRAWFMSLLIPVLAIAYPIASLQFIVPLATLGMIIGGFAPLVMIIRGRTDTSKFFLGKMILLAAAVGEFFLVFFSWFHGFWFWELLFIITSIVLVIAEIIFAVTRKTDRKTKLCLALSSAAWVNLGSTLNLLLVNMSY